MSLYLKHVKNKMCQKTFNCEILYLTFHYCVICKQKQFKLPSLSQSIQNGPVVVQ